MSCDVAALSFQVIAKYGTLSIDIQGTVSLIYKFYLGAFVYKLEQTLS